MSQLQEIEIKNYRRIRRAHLVIDGSTIVVSGENESGKTSFLNAIENLFGGKDYQPAVPVRKGATEAQIVGRLKAADGRVLTATVTIDPHGVRRLVVKDADGKAQGSPQMLLNAFWDETSFDPSHFLASKSAEQLNMLKQMLGIDFTALDKKRADLYAQRTGVNTSADQAQARAISMAAHPDAPAAEESSADVLAEIEKAAAHNNQRVGLESALDGFRKTVASDFSAIGNIARTVADLERRLQQEKANFEQATTLHAASTANETKAKAALDAFVSIDVTPLKTKLAGLEAANAKVRANAARKAAQEEAALKRRQSDLLTGQIDALDEEKQEVLQKAKYPVDGLAFNENGVTFDGLPLEQASDMRKVAIGVQMAAAMHPDKKIMLVRHGNFFDEAHFPLLNEIAEKNSLTCIIEVAGPARKDSSIVFVDGIGEAPAAK